MRFSKCGHDFATVLALNLYSMEIRLRVFITLTAKRRKKYHKFVHTLSHTHAQQYNRSIIFSLLRFEFCRFSLISLCFFPSSSSLLLFLSSFVIVFSLFALLCFVFRRSIYCNNVHETIIRLRNRPQRVFKRHGIYAFSITHIPLPLHSNQCRISYFTFYFQLTMNGSIHYDLSKLMVCLFLSLHCCCCCLLLLSSFVHEKP